MVGAVVTVASASASGTLGRRPHPPEPESELGPAVAEQRLVDLEPALELVGAKPELHPGPESAMAVPAMAVPESAMAVGGAPGHIELIVKRKLYRVGPNCGPTLGL